MNAGRIEQIGTPVEVEAAPATAFMYGFLGGASPFEVSVEAGRVSLAGRALPREAVVLVVDDSDDVRAVVRATVEKAGLKTVEAENGQVALDWLKKNPAPALVLLDLMMPVMDGFTFLEQVKHVPALAQVPIVVLTAKDLTEAERRMVNERTLLVLTKGAQPLSSLGSALAAIARQPAEKTAG